MHELEYDPCAEYITDAIFVVVMRSEGEVTISQSALLFMGLFIAARIGAAVVEGRGFLGVLMAATGTELAIR